MVRTVMTSLTTDLAPPNDDELEVPPMLTFEERMVRFEIDMEAFEQGLAA